MIEYDMEIDCPHCGETNGMDPIYDGETQRSMTCSECGKWFTPYSEYDV